MAEIDEAFFVNHLQSELARLGQGLHDALMEHEFPVSQARVPVEFETLKNTGYVSDPVIEGDECTVTIGYGTNEDETGIYAIVQEYRTDYNHPRGGQAYYLTQTVNEGAPTIVDRVASHASKQ